MSWTDRADDVSCCNGPLGAVGPKEHVARLLITGTLEPMQAAFKRSELHADGVVVISNACGDSHGLSVDRCDSLSDDDIRQRADVQAAKKPGRKGEGARIASVAALRAIRQRGSDEQVVFVYDDPRADNDHHSVVRISHTVPRTDYKVLAKDVMGAFNRRVA